MEKTAVWGFSGVRETQPSRTDTRTYYREAIIPAPDPPTNLQEDTTVRSTHRVGVTWSAPRHGSYDGFSIKITGLPAPVTRLLTRDDASETFDDVLPGAVYNIGLKTTLQSLYSTELFQLVTASKYVYNNYTCSVCGVY